MLVPLRQATLTGQIPTVSRFGCNINYKLLIAIYVLVFLCN